MMLTEDPFVIMAPEVGVDEFARLQQRVMTSSAADAPSAQLPPVHAPAVARLHGFDQDDRPVLSALSVSPGELVTSRTTVSLKRAMIGHQVLVVFENGDVRLPIITGVLQKVEPDGHHGVREPGMSVVADGDCCEIQAEREIVLRCGEASITLTRSGKVIIEGHYILSRSRGYNKIKGAAIDIN
jgi:hypothetical protein